MKKIACSLLALAPLAAMSHPGHGGTDGYTIIHYFTEPQHAVLTYGILAGGLAWMALRARAGSRSRKTR